nr:hypothetical protein [Chloroflexota bacterium]
MSSIERVAKTKRAFLFQPVVWIVLAALLSGFLLGRIGITEPASARTAVASPSASGTPFCEPPPSPTATVEPTPAPTATLVPPLAAGEPVPYAGDWTVTVVGISLMPSFSDLTATGRFAKVDLTIVNGGRTGRVFPYGDLVL